MSKKLQVAVLGAAGYTGEELVRLLAGHPAVQLAYVSAKEDRRAKIQELFPYLANRLDLECASFSPDEAAQRSDLLFLSLPHTASMEVAPFFLEKKKRVIDISADYRLKDAKVYEKFYGVPHKDPGNLKQAVYGLPETKRSQIKNAALVANPGCYSTGAILGILPGVRLGLFELDAIHVDAKSGVTGAGRKPERQLQFSEVNESVKAYKALEHQHVPEIVQELNEAAGSKTRVLFVPHLVPMNRGILSTIYARLKKPLDELALIQAYQEFYRNEPFVKVYGEGRLPETRHVLYTNFCDIGIHTSPEHDQAVIVTAIDNLGKGAAGQAVQSMNLMAGFDERLGL